MRQYDNVQNLLFHLTDSIPQTDRSENPVFPAPELTLIITPCLFFIIKERTAGKRTVFEKLWIRLLEIYDDIRGIEWEWQQSLDSVSVKAPLGGI
jgi:hypothetical protein